ncbi:MAG: right-handed parallel beta-helix repeat-containing protein [Ferruginibacter sp.]
MKTKNSLITLSPSIALITLSFFSATMKINNAVATDYYISAKGNDAADGLTPATSWLTIEKINKARFSPGDSILFQRGDSWREGQALYGSSDGMPGHPVVYGAYGKGAKPLILASKDISASMFWAKSSKDIWKTTSKINITSRDLILGKSRSRQITPDIANLIFNNEKLTGFKKRFLADLKTQGDFCLDLDDTILYLYSTVNPSVYYKKIEATGIRNAENNIEIINRHYLAFVNLDIRYSKNNGILLRDCSNIEITGCDFSWIGGCYFPIDTYMRSSDPNPARMGNGIQLWQGNSDVTIKNCNISEVYDAGISPQGVGAVYSIQNLRIHHNLIRDCFYSFEFWGHEAGSTGKNIFFENNTCLNSGGGWSTAQRPDKERCAHLQFSSSKMSFSNVFIRNNIFYESFCFCSDGKAESNGSNTDAVWDAFTIDNNCYYQSSKKKQIIRWRGGSAKGGGDYFMDDLKAYQAKSGKELHTIFTDPKLGSDFRLQPGSPAIDAGIDIGYTYTGVAPDMGAFEFAGGSSNPPAIRRSGSSKTKN